MKLQNVTNVTGLIETLDTMQDNVSLAFADGREFDWQTGRHILEAMMQSFAPGKIRSLSIRFESTKDADNMMRFLMENSTRAASAA